MLAIEIKIVLFSTLIMFSVATIFAVVLVILSKKLAVPKDPKIDKIYDCLSKANCGGCGFAGCEAFATALVEGKAKIENCSVSSKENKQKIAKILGTEASSFEEMQVVVCCNGGNACQDKYEYLGYGNCNTAQMLANGQKACNFGCMGLGSCVDACGFLAIEVGEDGYGVIDKEKCTTCGACISACPKKLIKRIPKKAKVFVACSSDCKGKEVREHCRTGCIACGLCAKNCPVGAIEMVNNLPQIDYDKCIACGLCAQKCPTKCMKYID